MTRTPPLAGACRTRAQSSIDAETPSARPIIDGERWKLGAKLFVTGGTEADLFVVLAKTGRTITAFLVERGAPGFSARPLHGKLGMRASDTAALFFEETDAEQLGAVGRGLMGVVGVLDRGRAGMGAIAVGVARACAEETSPKSARRRRTSPSPKPPSRSTPRASSSAGRPGSPTPARR